MTDNNDTGARRYGALLAQNFIVVYAFYLGPVVFFKLLDLMPSDVARVRIQGLPIHLAIYALGAALTAVVVAALSLWGGASPMRPARLLGVAVASFALGLVFGIVRYSLGPNP